MTIRLGKSTDHGGGRQRTSRLEAGGVALGVIVASVAVLAVALGVIAAVLVGGSDEPAVSDAAAPDPEPSPAEPSAVDSADERPGECFTDQSGDVIDVAGAPVIDPVAQRADIVDYCVDVTADHAVFAVRLADETHPRYTPDWSGIHHLTWNVVTDGDQLDDGRVANRDLVAPYAVRVTPDGREAGELGTLLEQPGPGGGQRLCDGQASYEDGWLTSSFPLGGDSACFAGETQLAVNLGTSLDTAEGDVRIDHAPDEEGHFQGFFHRDAAADRDPATGSGRDHVHDHGDEEDRSGEDGDPTVDETAGHVPEPLDVIEHGSQYWAVLWVGDYGDASLDGVRDAIEQRWGPVWSDGDIGCNDGAAEALGADPDARAVAVHFVGETDARQFAERAALPSTPTGAALVTTYCLD